jgi:hypothetical protein
MPSPGMLRRVALVRSDVAVECSTLCLLVTANVVPSSPIFVTQMTEAILSSEISILNRAVLHNMKEDGILYSHHRGNLKSYLLSNGSLPSIQFIASETSVKPHFSLLL